MKESVMASGGVTRDVVAKVVAKHRGTPGELLGALEELQNLHPHKYLPPEVMEMAAEAAGVPGMANLLVSATPPKEFERALAGALTPEDAGFVIETTNGTTVVKNRRVFLPKAVPEALAARELGMRRLVFSLVTNLGTGLSPNPLTHEDVVREADRAGAKLQELLEILLPRL